VTDVYLSANLPEIYLNISNAHKYLKNNDEAVKNAQLATGFSRVNIQAIQK
jgi:hypothetical protein